MKDLYKFTKVLIVAIIMMAGLTTHAQTPTYSCVAMNDTLISATVYQFDVYIYQTGATAFYLNDFQLSFQISNTTGILNGGTITASYVSGSTQLPSSLIPSGVSTYLVGGNYEIRVNGVTANSNGSLVPTTGLRVGTFQITNTAAFAQANMNLSWWNTVPAATYIYAIVPPAVSGTTALITSMSYHTSNLTNPLLNAPVTAFNITGAGSYCTGNPGLAIGLDGSQTGVMYKLFQNGTYLASNVAGTGSAITFGTHPAATYTATAYRKATYLTNNMNGSAVVTALPNNPVSISIAFSANPVCSGSSVTFTATPANGGTTPSYQWQVNGVNAGTNSSSYTYIPVANDAVRCILTSNVSCPTGNPATSNTVTMTVNALPSAPTSGGNQSICSGQTIPALTVTVGSGQTADWYAASSGGSVLAGGTGTLSYTPSSAGTYYAQARNTTTSCISATRTGVTLTINALPSAPTSGGDQAICSGQTIPALTVTVGSGQTSDWYAASSGGSVLTGGSGTLSYTPSSAGTYYAQARNTTTSCVSATRTGVTLTINALPSAPTSGGDQAICSGQTIPALTVTVGSGQTADWYAASSGGSVLTGGSGTLSYTPASAGTYYAQARNTTTSCVSATRTGVTLTINALPSAPTSGGNQSICSGQTIPALTVTVGSGQTADWYAASSGGSVLAGGTGTLSYTPSSAGTYYAQARNTTTSCVSATRTGVTLTVNALPSAPTSGGDQTICSGQTIPALTVTVGSGQTADWYAASSGGSVLAGGTGTLSYTPSSAGTYYAQARNTTTSCVSVTRTGVTLTVNALPSAPTSGGDQTICSGQTIPALTVTVGSGQTADWYAASSGGSVLAGGTGTLSYTPSSAGTYYAQARNTTTSCVSVTRTGVALTVNALPSAPTSGGDQTICSGETIPALTVTVGSGQTADWYAASSGGSVLAGGTGTLSYTPSSAGTYYAQARNTTTSCVSATRTGVTLTVNALPSAPTSGGNQSICSGQTIPALTVTVGSGQTADWYAASSGGSVLTGGTGTLSYTPASAGTYYAQARNTTTSCVSATRTGVSLTINALPSAPTSGGNQSICSGQTIPALTVTVGSGQTADWYAASSGGSVLTGGSGTLSYTPASAGTYYAQARNTTTSCVSATRTGVTLTVNVLPIPTFITAPGANTCVNSNTSYTTQSGQSSYVWNVNGILNTDYSIISGSLGSNSNSVTLQWLTTGSKTVTINYNNSNGCTGASAASSTTTVNALPTPTIIGNNVVCAGSTGNVYTTQTGSGINNYIWSVTNGIITAGGTTADNSVTITWNIVGNQSLSVNYLNGNGCTAQTPSVFPVTVNATSPVSVSIGASSNNICSGTSITFTATPTNGGTTPTYQWKVNSIAISGATNPTYTYVPVNNDAVTCVLTSNATCSTGNPATSNTINMIVNTVLPVSVSIGASQNNICAGTSVTFTATPTNGGTTPSYQWKVNSIAISGATNPTYTYVPVNNDAVTCVLTSNATCASGSPATSNTINMIVNPLLPVSVSVGASQNNICAGTSVTFTATPTNGGTTPSYQWKVNSIAISGAINPTYTYVPVNNDAVTCVLTSNATCVSGSPATSNTINMIVNPLLPVSVSVGASQNNICSGTSVTLTATPTNGGTTPSYQWKVNSIAISGAINPTYTYVPVNNDAVTCVLTSNATCASGNPATSNTINMIVNPLLPVSVSIGASQNNICSGTSVTFTATPTNGGLAPAYQWKVNNIAISGATNPSYTYVPVNNDAVTCVLTSNATCVSGSPATSNTINMIVNPLLPVSVSVGASQNNICAGTSVTFTATPTNGGTTPSYQWKVNSIAISGAINPTYTYVPVNNNAVTCVLTSNATCASGSPATSNTINMIVNPLLPVSVSVGASQNNICAGTSVTFTATPTNGGLAPSYQWKVNNIAISGATNPTYTYVPVNNDAVTCVLTSNATCVSGSPATSNTINMIVNPLLPVSVSVGASQNNICAGTSVTFTATPTNGGLAPSYQWKVNNIAISGATNPTYTYVPVNNDAVTCVLTSNATCVSGSPATSNTINMIVNPLLPVSVSVGASQNNICSGTSVTFTATPTNGGLAPAYQWKVNSIAISGATNPTYTYVPLNTDAVSCVITSDLTCSTGNPATSNTINMIVNPLLPVSVSVGASQNNICAGTSVTFTATPTNGGLAPSYQWKVNNIAISGATNPTYTYVPVNNDAVTCVLTSNATCVSGSPATSNTINMIVNPLLPVSVSIGASQNNICSGTSVTFTATPTNGGLAPAYQWKVNSIAIPGATNPSYTYVPVNNDAVTCVLTSNATCVSGSPATSNTINMIVNPLLPVSVSIGASQNNICSGTSVTFTATPTNGGTTPTYQWKVNSIAISGATNPSYTYVPVNNDAVTCVLTSNATCVSGSPATSNTINMIVNPLLPVSVSVGASQNNICSGTSVTFTATPTNGGTTPSYQWKVNSIAISGATNPTYTYVPVNNDAVTCVLTSNATCASGSPATSNTINMIVNPQLPVSVSVGASQNNICSGTSVTFTATPTNGGLAPAYQWKVNSIAIPGATNPSYTYVPVNNDAVICVLTSSATCASGNPATSNTINMIVNPLLPVSVSIGASQNNICSGTSVTFTATPTNGGLAPAYQWKVNSIAISGATNPTYTYVPVNNDAVICVLTSSATCASGNPATSNTINMIVNPLLPVSVSIGASSNNICAGTSVTFTATPTNGGLAPAYQWKVNSIAIPGATNPSYTYVPVNNDAVTCVLTSSATCASGNPATSNTINMIVNTVLPVSVSIGASQNNICSGTSVTFTATPTNGGLAPAYQWKVNSIAISGATNPSYTYVPGNNDAVTCVLTSSATCASGNPATSNTINMIVNTVLPVSVSIGASQNNICSGTSVTFTATPTNGGLAPAYQWKVNSIAISGATNPSYTYVPGNNDAVTCVLTSSATCASGNPATSNTINMIVNPLLPVSVSIGASQNNICSGTSVTFTATPTNGGLAPAYQWKVNNIAISGATNPSYTYVPVNNDAVTCVLTSSATCASGSPATSNTINMIVNTVLPVSVSIGASSNNICAGTSVTFTATPTNGGLAPAYQWKVNSIAISGATNPTYTYVPVNNDAVTCVLTSNATCSTGSPATSNTINMIVNPQLPVSVSIGASQNNICSGTSVTFTATPTNGGTTPTYQWKVNSIAISGATNPSYTYVPVNNDAVTCVLTSNATCVSGSPATSNTINMIVNPLLPVSVSIGASQNNICSGTSVTFTATPTNGGLAPAYQWKVNSIAIPGATNPSYTYVPVNNDAVTCVLTSNATCASGSPATSNTINMIVNTVLPVSVSIGASQNNICSGTSVTFTATPTNGGTTPSYQWKVNSIAISGATNPTYTYVPLNTDAVSCVITSDLTCSTGNPATSNTINMIVNPLLPVSVSVGASQNNICSGTSVTFTATPTNGGLAPAYQWKVNSIAISGATNPTYTYVPVNNDAVTCVLTSSATCASGNPATSNTINMIVNPQLPVSVSVGASQNNICSGTSVTFTATPTNGGTTPSYQWKVNSIAIPGATNPSYTYVPVNNDAVTCVLTSNATCASGSPATSNTINMIVNTVLPVSVSIGASQNNICSGTSVTFTATPTNGGLAPAYQWKVNSIAISGATNPSYTYVPVNSDAVTCVLTSNATCSTGNPATSNTINMIVNPLLPVSVSIGASQNNICAGTSVTFTATPTNGGTTPSYQWKVNSIAISGATNPTYTYVPVNNDAVTCVLTSNATCVSGSPATSNTINMIVNPQLPVSVSVGASQNNICSGTSVTFTATPTNGGLAPAYQWKVNSIAIPGATNPSYTYVPVNNDAVICVLTSSATCASGNPATSNTINMIVNPLLPVSVSIGASQNNICSGTSVTFTATPTNGGLAPAYQWKVNSIAISGATNPTYTYVPVNNDAVICVLTSSATCASGNPATSNTINMIVNPLLPVSVSIGASSNNICAGTSVTFTATPTNGGLAPAYQWKVNSIAIPGATNPSYTYVPVNNDAVTCVLTSSATCASGNPATSNTINMIVNTVLPVSVSIGASQNNICSGTSVTFTATPTNGGLAPAYQWKVNSIAISGATNPSYTYVPGNNDAVTCVLTSSATCASGNPATSNTINMIVNTVLPVSVSIGASQNNICSGTSVTFTATPTNGGLAPAYQWKVNSIAISGATNPTYTYVPVNNDAVTCVLTSSATCVSGNPATSNTINMIVNPLLPVSVSVGASQNNICSGTSVTFTATPTNGGLAPAYQWKVNSIAISGATNPSYTYVPVNNDAVTCVLTSNATCSTGSPATSNTINMIVNPLLPVSVSVGASQNNICSGTSVTFTATPTNGGLAPAYQWKVNSIAISGATNPSYTYVPGNNDAVTCVLTSSATCASGNPATSNTINMIVNPLLPVSVSIGASQNNICSGTSVTFTATPTNGGLAPAYQWKVNNIAISGATNPSYTYVPVNNDAVTCVLTSSATCASGSPATSNTINMIVNTVLPVSVSIGASSNNICAGTSVTFTATPTNGGLAPAYQWKVNSIAISGATNPTYTYVPVNNDAVTCVLTSNATCSTGSPATSNTINMIVNTVLPVSVSIGASQNNICSGTSVTFTATPTNGGLAPAYQWKVNSIAISGATNPTYTYVPLNTDAVSCVITSDLTCSTGNPATSNTINMIVNTVLPVSVSIGASQNNICSGTSVTFTATPTNGGLAPAYQWKVNSIAISGATNPTYTYVPLNTDAVSCVITSDLTCSTGNPATSNTINMIVNTVLPVSVSIGASQNNICSGTSVTFTATPTNGGTTPSYQWKVNSIAISGATNPSYTYVPVNNDAVTCVLTSSATCASGSPATSNTINMIVNPQLPVSVSIGASQNNICSGTSVTFTATPTNGGLAPAYQWKVNNIAISGATNPSYTYVPVNNDAVICVLTSSATCASGNPATSNTINMIVNPQLPVSVSVGASQNNICSGTSVTFTATPTNGGTTPSYQWKVNSIAIPGATNPSYTYVPVNNDAVTCVLTSNATCASGSPATSNTINMIVNPQLPVSVSVGASQNNICAGTSVTFTATPTNGGTTPSYQWKVNSIAISGATNPTYTYVPVNNDAVTCVLTSNATCSTGSPATSNTINMIVNTVLPVSVSIGASQNNICSGTSVTFTATPTNGGLAPAYQWKVNSIAISGATNPTYTYVPLNTDAVSCVITSDLTCSTGNPATSNTINMIVNTVLPVSVSIGASQNNICSGTSVTFTATPTNGGLAPAYQWKVNSIAISGATNPTYTYVPLNTDAVSCVITSDLTCSTGNPATSNTINMIVNTVLPVSVSIGASQNNICSGTSVTFTATPTNGGTTPSYQWKVNSIAISGATNPSYTYVPVNNDAVTCVLTSSATCASGSPATSNTINMIVNPQLPVSVSVGASQNNICSGTSVTFTATPTNGGLAPAYQWKVNSIAISGATNPTYTYVPLNTDAVTCVITSDLTCSTGNPATSNTINMIVNPQLPVSVSIGASQNNICSGTSVTFTATPTNGGLAPAYQWKVNNIAISGATNPSYTYVPVNNDAVICVLTSSATCASGSPATSNTINMIVNTVLPVSVSVGASQNNICAGTSVTFTATPTNGGTTPTYQWKVNNIAISGATNPTYTYVPVNNDAVICVLTSSATCASGSPATSNTINMIVNTVLPVSVSVGASQNNICAGTSVTFTATPTNGGTTPTYQWKVNNIAISGATNPTYTYVPVNNDAVICVLTSDANCVIENPAVSNTIMMIINPDNTITLTSGPGTDAQTVCVDNPIISIAYQTTGATGALFSGLPSGITGNWSANLITISGSPTVSGLYTYTISLTGGCGTVNRNGTINVIPTVGTPTPIIVSAGTEPSCQLSNGTTTTTYSTSATNSTGFNWSINNPGAGNINTMTGVMTWSNGFSGSVNIQVTANGCNGPSPQVMRAVTVNADPVPTLTGPSSVCINSTGNVYTTESGKTNYQWSVSAGGTITSGGGPGNNTATITWNTVGVQTVSVSYTNPTGCSAVVPTVYSITVNPLPVPTITGQTNLCVNSGFYYYNTEAGMSNYVWTVSSGGILNSGSGTNQIQVSWIVPGAQSVSVTYSNAPGCNAAQPTVVGVTVNPQPDPAGPITGTANVCAGATGIAYSVATIPNATSYIWILPPNTSISSGAGTNSIIVNFANNAGSGNMYVYGTNFCGAGGTSPAYSVSIESLPDPAGIISGPNNICVGDSAVVYSVATIGNAAGYNWTVPFGVLIVNGNNTNSITVDFTPNAVSGNITVQGVNSCGDGIVSPNFNITVNPIPPAPIVTNTGNILHSSAPVGNQWYFEGSLIIGANSQNYLATQTGYYWDVVNLSGCSSDTSNHKLIILTGIQPHPTPIINLYPVPNNGKFNISITTVSEEDFSFMIYNDLGVKIYEETKVQVNGSLTKTIDFRPVPNGMYTIIITDKQETIRKKIVIDN